MFFMNCGTQLPDGAKFCMSCGTKMSALAAEQPADQTLTPAISDVSKQPVPDHDDSHTTQTELQADNDTPEGILVPKYRMEVGGYTLEIDQSIIDYNIRRKRFVEASEKSRVRFESYYKENVHDFSSMYWYYTEFAKDIYEKAFDLAIHEFPHYPYDVGPYVVFYATPYIKNDDVNKLAEFFGMESEYKEKIAEFDRNKAKANTSQIPWLCLAFCILKVFPYEFKLLSCDVAWIIMHSYDLVLFFFLFYFPFSPLARS